MSGLIIPQTFLFRTGAGAGEQDERASTISGDAEVPNLPRPQLSDVATLKIDSVYGEDDDIGATRYCQ